MHRYSIELYDNAMLIGKYAFFLETYQVPTIRYVFYNEAIEMIRSLSAISFQNRKSVHMKNVLNNRFPRGAIESIALVETLKEMPIQSNNIPRTNDSLEVRIKI